jgi:uncharacterized protein (DUF433 family)
MNGSNPRGLTIETLSDEEFAEAIERRPVVDWRACITVDPDIAFGKPVVAGTRIAVEFILDLFASGWTESMVLDSYPGLSPASLRAVFAYAADLAHAQQQRPAWLTEG